MTIRDRLSARGKKISEWDAQQLARFCEVGYQIAGRQFSACLNGIGSLSDRQREVVHKALMTEVEILAENLIVLALDSSHLDGAKLKQTSEQKTPRRNLILAEEDD